MKPFALFSTLALAAASLAGPTPSKDEIARVVREGKDRSQVMRILKDLTDRGPRLTGSPNLAKSQQWAMAEFRRLGAKNVRLEKWGDVPVGFERGPRQRARIVSPRGRNIEFTTNNWLPGTEGPVRGAVVRAPKDLAALQTDPTLYRGAWVLVPNVPGMRGAPSLDSELDKALDAAGVAGRLYGARDERLHSSGNWRGKSYDVRPKQVQVLLKRSDWDRLDRQAELGLKPVAEFDIENRWFKGPVPQYNVVAEIPGTDLKDEVVIVCGHFDSWNSPGSQGACDNGTGSSVTLEAARILAAAKVKPRRTIRFILWSGEEQGLFGSRGYVETHKKDLDKVVAVLNDDGGTNYQGGYQGLASHKPILEAAFAPTVAAFPNLPMEVAVVEGFKGGGSSDHAPFAWAGVPAYFTIEKGRADYGKVWHTQYDRYEEAIPEYLMQSATNHALVSLHLATIDERLERFAPRPQQAVDLNHALAVGADHEYEDPANHAYHDHTDDWVLELVDRLQRTAQTIFRSF